MKITRNNETNPTIKATGYTMRLSARETAYWANALDASWPCSTLSDKRVFIAVDSNGLYDIAVNGSSRAAEHIDGHELDSMVADMLPADLKHLWPCWA